jgi:fructose/tagatose bisphosphate aldolase
MALISLRRLLDHAAENDYGVPAFNVNNLEQIRAIMEGADESNSPVILQASAGARKYAGSNFLRHLIQGALEEFPHIPIVMHQDHGFAQAPYEEITKEQYNQVKKNIKKIKPQAVSNGKQIEDLECAGGTCPVR